MSASDLARLALEAFGADDGGELRSLLRQGLHPDAMAGDLPLAYWALKAPRCLAALLEAGASFARSDRGLCVGPPCFCAAHDGQAESLEMLIRAGFDPEQPDGMGYPPLSVAAARGHADCVAILLAAGARPDLASATGHSPAMFAASDGHAECLRLLIEAGADLLSPSPLDSDTAAGIALACSQTECHDLILAALARREAASLASHLAPAAPREAPPRL